MLATSSGLTSPSSGQYLQKLKSASACSISPQLYAPAFLSFYKYWPDDGLVRLKLIANI
jgi:hypothetical protein